MDDHPQNDWESIRYDSRFDVYWIEAGGACQQLFYCPFCGEKLPPSRRDEWFDRLDELGIEPAVDPIPDDFQTGVWRGDVPKRFERKYDGGPIEGRYLNLFELPDDMIGED